MANTPRTTTPTNQGSLLPSPKPRPEPTNTPEPMLNVSGGSGPGMTEDAARNAPTPALSDSLAMPEERSSTPGGRSATPVKAINIPTGDRLDEEEEVELTAAQRRERTLRDQQIDQITDLLVGAITSTKI